MSHLVVPVGPKDHVRGQSDVPVTLVEYGDFECPYCGRAFPIMEQILEDFKNQILFAFRHFPLTQIHPHSQQAAEAAEAAGAEDKFWEMHRLLFENQDALDDLALVEYAQALDLNLENFEQALERHTYLPKIEADFLSGIKSGVNGTPTFFINGRRHDDSFEYDVLSRAIATAIEDQRQG